MALLGSFGFRHFGLSKRWGMAKSLINLSPLVSVEDILSSSKTSPWPSSASDLDKSVVLFVAAWLNGHLQDAEQTLTDKVLPGLQENQPHRFYNKGFFFEAGLRFAYEVQNLKLMSDLSSTYQSVNLDSYKNSRMADFIRQHIDSVFQLYDGTDDRNETYTYEILCNNAINGYLPNPASERKNIAIVTSGLGAGGAERQFANTVFGLSKRQNNNTAQLGDLQVQIRFSSRLNNSNFFLSSLDTSKKNRPVCPWVY